MNPEYTQNLLQGLSISIIGLLIAFIFMGIFILVMNILKKLFPYKPEAVEEESEEEGDAGNEDVAPEIQPAGEEEVAVAIAAALAYFQSASQSKLGEQLQVGRGPYWTANRLAARQRRTLHK